MSGIDKAWSDLGGHPVVWHSLFQLSSLASQTILVVKPDDTERAQSQLANEFAQLIVVSGGTERQFSVQEGLKALTAQVDAIAVHDAARPFANPELLRTGCAALLEADGAIPVMEVPDTIKRVNSRDTVLETVDRSSLRAAQTPQVFRASALRSAHARASSTGTPATDDASLLEGTRYRVVTFPGSRTNIKITTLHDLQIARAMLEKGER